MLIRLLRNASFPGDEEPYWFEFMLSDESPKQSSSNSSSFLNSLLLVLLRNVGEFNLIDDDEHDVDVGEEDFKLLVF